MGPMIRGIGQGIGSFDRVAHIDDEVCASRKPDRSDPVRIDTIGCGPFSQQTDGALRVFQAEQDLWSLLFSVNARPDLGRAVFEHGAGHALPGDPVAHLGAFEVGCHSVEPSPGDDEHRGAGVATFRAIDRHGRPGDICRPVPFASANQRRAVAGVFGMSAAVWLCQRNVRGPERKLRSPIVRFPDPLLLHLRNLDAFGRGFLLVGLGAGRASNAQTQEKGSH